MVGILSPQQVNFVNYLVSEGCSQTEAARRAGYAHPKQAAYALLQKEHVMHSIRAAQESMIGADLANIALKTLKAVMETEKFSAASRVSAARTVMEIGGYLGNRPREQALEDKRIEDMSADEIDRFIVAGYERLGIQRN